MNYLGLNEDSDRRVARLAYIPEMVSNRAPRPGSEITHPLYIGPNSLQYPADLVKPRLRGALGRRGETRAARTRNKASRVFDSLPDTVRSLGTYINVHKCIEKFT